MSNMFSPLFFGFFHLNLNNKTTKKESFSQRTSALKIKIIKFDINIIKVNINNFNNRCLLF
jgi:hypothetical protein